LTDGLNASLLNNTCAACGETAAGDCRRPRPQTEFVEWAIRLFMGGVPTLLCIASVYIKSQFPIQPEYTAQFQKGIETHNEDPTAPVHDPVTVQVVQWLPRSALSESERELTAKFDIFPLGAIRRSRAEKSFVGLRQRSVVFTVGTCVFVVTSMSVTIATVLLGWLTDKSVQLIPTMGCICIGLGVTVVAIAIPRLRTSRALTEIQPFPAELLDRYCSRFQPALSSSATKPGTQLAAGRQPGPGLAGSVVV